jgi:uncharacterized protein DUF6378
MSDPVAIQDVLNERGKRYGAFCDQALLSQSLKVAMRLNDGHLAPDQREALEMIAHKIARILSGDPNYPDSWVDIAGYAQLVANRLRQTQ